MARLRALYDPTDGQDEREESSVTPKSVTGQEPEEVSTAPASGVSSALGQIPGVLGKALLTAAILKGRMTPQGARDLLEIFGGGATAPQTSWGSLSSATEREAAGDLEGALSHYRAALPTITDKTMARDVLTKMGKTAAQTRQERTAKELSNVLFNTGQAVITQKIAGGTRAWLIANGFRPEDADRTVGKIADDLRFVEAGVTMKIYHGATEFGEIPKEQFIKMGEEALLHTIGGKIVGAPFLQPGTMTLGPEQMPFQKPGPQIQFGAVPPQGAQGAQIPLPQGPGGPQGAFQPAGGGVPPPGAPAPTQAPPGASGAGLTPLLTEPIRPRIRLNENDSTMLQGSRWQGAAYVDELGKEGGAYLSKMREDIKDADATRMSREILLRQSVAREAATDEFMKRWQQMEDFKQRRPIGKDAERFVHIETLGQPSGLTPANELRADPNYVELDRDKVKAVAALPGIRQMFAEAAEVIQRRTDLFPRKTGNWMKDRMAQAGAMTIWNARGASDPDIKRLTTLDIEIPVVIKAFHDTGNIAIGERLMTLDALGLRAGIAESMLESLNVVGRLVNASLAPYRLGNYFRAHTLDTSKETTKGSQKPGGGNYALPPAVK